MDGQDAGRKRQGVRRPRPGRRAHLGPLQNGYEAVLKNYPDIEVIGYYNGEYALGPEQAGVASLLAANPEWTASLLRATARAP